MSNPFVVVDSPQISCVSDPGRAMTQVALRGNWDGALRQETSRVLRACVAEAPWVLLVDLAGLQDPYGDSLSTWHTAARFTAQADPPVTVVLAAAPPAVRERLSTDGSDPRVVLADTVDAALTVVPSLNGGLRQHHMALPAHPVASGLARTMVGDTCTAFDVAHLMYPARLIVSELVTNAVRHTGTDLDVWVSARGAALHLAVQDRSREYPRLIDSGHRDPDGPPESGMGLRVVSATATGWGVLPWRHGKMVWATLAIQAAAS